MKKDQSAQTIMETFTLENIPSLDTAILSALEIASQTGLQKQKKQLEELFKDCKRPLVVGSGNAEVTGKILFKDKDAIIANESNFEIKLKNTEADSVIIISASGGKHAPQIAKLAKLASKRTYLLTNNADAKAKEEIAPENVIIFPKQREPYTYNTTYLFMILAKTEENPLEILDFINKEIEPKLMAELQKLKNNDGFFITLPKCFDETSELFMTKFTELFGRRISKDVFTEEKAKHATTVVPYENELFLNIGTELFHGDIPDKMIKLPFPDQLGIGALMSVGYYLIGKIQEQKEGWFKKNLERYCENASKLFNEKIMPIIER